MTQINPFTGSVLQSTTVQRTQSAERDRQIQRAQSLAKNAAVASDRLEHQVESAEELRPIRDEPQNQPRQRRRSGKRRPDEQTPDEPGHLDLTA
jgi:hypothetical protein